MESSTAKSVVRSRPVDPGRSGRKIAENEPLRALLSRAAAACGASWTLRRTHTTSRAGSAPVQNITRQARSPSASEKITVYTITASAQPTAQELCTAPRVRPRCLVLAYSATRIAPTAHSPPKPSPWSARNTRSVS